MYKKILGGLVGAAAGDAMGAATETRTRSQIEERFGGYVTEFLTPPMDTFARGSRAGQVTDDFSVAYMTLKEILKTGEITKETVRTALLAWSEIPEYFDRFAGPTTRARVQELKGNGRNPDIFVPVNDNNKATNGGAMKAAPIALLSKGDVDQAIADALMVSQITHNNNIALSGTAAIAAATGAALKSGATVYDIVSASLYGAGVGDRYGREHGCTLAGASIETRIRWAVSIAVNSGSLSEAMDELSDYIGSGLMAVEAVPAAIGLCVAAKGCTVDGICAAVNIGNDTDTVATMVGGILGALNGIDSMPQHYMDMIESENHFDLEAIARQIVEYR